MKTIAFFDTKPYDRQSFDKVNANYGFNIKYIPAKLNETTVPLAKGVDAVCVFVNDTVDQVIIDKLLEMDIKLVALRCAGYNNVDTKHAYKKLHLVRVPAYSPHAVAEYTLALILTLNRKTHRAYNRTKDLNFNINGFVGFDLKGRTAGVIGTGQIGRIVSSILNGFGMKVLLTDPFPDKEFAKSIGADYVDLKTLCNEADIVSLNCPLTPETYHIINDETIEAMKDGVMIINTGRGPLIDTDALIKGLKSRKVGSAGLDVYEEESDYFFEDFSNDIIDDDRLGRLLTFNNVLITSHQAFFTEDALGNIATTTLQNIKDFFSDDKLPNEICYHVCDDECDKEENGRCW